MLGGGRSRGSGCRGGLGSGLLNLLLRGLGLSGEAAAVGAAGLADGAAEHVGTENGNDDGELIGRTRMMGDHNKMLAIYVETGRQNAFPQSRTRAFSAPSNPIVQ